MANHKKHNQQREAKLLEESRAIEEAAAAAAETFEDDLDNEDDYENAGVDEAYRGLMKKVRGVTAAAREGSIDHKRHLVIGSMFGLDDSTGYMKTIREWTPTYKEARKNEKRLTARRIICALVAQGCRFYEHRNSKSLDGMLVPIKSAKRIEDRIMKDVHRCLQAQDQDTACQEQPAVATGRGKHDHDENRPAYSSTTAQELEEAMAGADDEEENSEKAAVQDASVALNTLMVQATTAAAEKAMGRNGSAQNQNPPVQHVNVPTEAAGDEASTSRPSPSSLVTDESQGSRKEEEDCVLLDQEEDDPPPLALTRDIGSWDANQEYAKDMEDSVNKNDLGKVAANTKEARGNTASLNHRTGREKAAKGGVKRAAANAAAEQQAQEFLAEHSQVGSRRGSFSSVSNGLLLPRPNETAATARPPLELLAQIAAITKNPVAAPKKQPPATSSRTRSSPRKAAAKPPPQDTMPPPKPPKRARRSTSAASASSAKKEKAPAKTKAASRAGAKSTGRGPHGMAASSQKRAGTRAAKAKVVKKSGSTKKTQEETYFGQAALHHCDEFDNSDENFQRIVGEMMSRLQGIESRMRLMETQNRRFKQRLVDLEDEEDRRGSETIEHTTSLTAADYQSAEEDAEEGEADVDEDMVNL